MGFCFSEYIYFKEILINQSIMKTPRMLPKLLMLVVVFVISLLIRIRESQASLAKAGCQEMCGNVTIPYPFGIGAGCHMHESFEVSCIRSSHDHVPLWFANDHEFPILENFPQILVHVVHESKSRCAEFEFTYGLDTPGQYFSLSHERNLYVTVGCNITAYFLVYPLIGTVCKALCNETSPVIGSPTSCTGFNGCCHLSIPKNVTSIIQYYDPKQHKQFIMFSCVCFRKQCTNLF
ncbi:putative wall-associated receptor kinase, galacturonan-binding domain-containing protein [Helianthus annuus]|nr:putative wall-associated receptor kinase, galacturonan-binding domain-containing protein [Helianthus annuus]KAJ0597922.1 putative wall-associated receptor kinase, galacturonan-binding domain-containing protein [Helianthus annuus]KAJ0758549.1 putative wall-associated receptor kinase, galacturonan-binding domain-containing protein [Helianthus annuus]